MKTRFSNVLKISSVYVASTIGAAFASGQEIIKFFTRFEIKSFPGVFIAGFLFAVVAIAVLDIVYYCEVKNSGELLNILGGKLVGKFFEYMTLLFSFCIFIVMIAGAAALWNRLTDFSYTSGVLIMTLICIILISFNIRGILTVSEVLTPLMIGGMLYLGVKVIFRSQAVISQGTSLTNNWLTYAFLYACYNSILNILVMSSMYPWITTRKTSIYSGIAGGTALFFAMWVLNQALYMNLKTIRYTQLPMVEISAIIGKLDFLIYSLILAFALITTAISSGFCFVKGFEAITKKPRWLLNICMGMLAVPFANQGFSDMVGTIYPVFGYLGSSLVILLIIRWLQIIMQRRKSPQKKRA
ncbi:MAG: hypothetical protein GX045_07995 [Clostridiaceae bacterium]|jgi:uncharacterized membrane protein YkvI|nr:hypothetical protein [Clostridiaceae bacterium]